MSGAGRRAATNSRQGFTLLGALGFAAAWAWTLLAGGGGVWLLLTKGPWPSFLKVNFGAVLLWRLAAAALIFLAGHAALLIQGWM
jgi:hypothetical protein